MFEFLISLEHGGGKVHQKEQKSIFDNWLRVMTKHMHCTQSSWRSLLKTLLGVLHLIGTLHNTLLTLWAILSVLKNEDQS
jgi:hypothetical protein